MTLVSSSLGKMLYALFVALAMLAIVASILLVIMLRGDKRNARVHQCLLCVQDVERGALTDPCLFADTVERDFRRSDLRLRRLHLRLARDKLAP